MEDVAGEELEHILIHEICHAVTTTAHGAMCRRRMQKVAEQAERQARPCV